MAAGADFSPPFTALEDSYSKGNGPLKKDEISENLENLKQKTSRKPPQDLSVVRSCISSDTIAAATDLNFCQGLDLLSVSCTSPIDGEDFCPVLRSGSCAEKGQKQYMEDEHICVDDLLEYLGATVDFPSPGAFYGVFDGHGGTDAASFIRKNILKFIIEESHFPLCLEKAVKNAFIKADHVFADDSSLDSSSGTTALTAIIFQRTLLIANAGDCRAVLGRRGRAVELSRDHKPNCAFERLRIEKLGGVVYDGYLNGQLSVARALGDWHMKGPKGSDCPLSAEPELQETLLTEEDEFLIMGCDGLWDVMSSQSAVTMARKELMLHNDPQRCARELVREALKLNTCDNLTVIVVCFSLDPPPHIEIPQSQVWSVSAEGMDFVKGVGQHLMEERGDRFL
ncbi:Phosphoprotein phosphatase [Bertholletia excelsa]